ncbi:MAG TPA: energy transducer TonB [Hymenobacter sp.]
MLLLPTFNATLAPCSVGSAAFSAHPQGHFCGQCQRVVQDFSRSQHPAADLAAARAASADGRVCGTFRREQIAARPTPTLSRRLRWFLMALVLVVGQGLAAQEALAQVRKPVPHKPTVHHNKHTAAAKKQPREEVPLVEDAYYTSGIIALEETIVEEPSLSSAVGKVYTYVEQMPQLPGGGGIQAIVPYIQQRVRWPVALSKTAIEGRVYANFIVDENGLVRDAKIIKGLSPLLDAETLRVIQALPAFTPGSQNGQPVAVQMTVPVTFKLK